MRRSSLILSVPSTARNFSHVRHAQHTTPNACLVMAYNSYGHIVMAITIIGHNAQRMPSAGWVEDIEHRSFSDISRSQKAMPKPLVLLNVCAPRHISYGCSFVEGPKEAILRLIPTIPVQAMTLQAITLYAPNSSGRLTANNFMPEHDVTS